MIVVANLIKPTVGRSLHYWPHVFERTHMHAQPFVAFITHVHSDMAINIAYFNEVGVLHTSVFCTLAQDRGAMPGECSWMAYQIGQARINVEPSLPTN